MQDSSDEGHSAVLSHNMRITNHGKIQAWVDFALEFLEKNEERPLTLHTLPTAKAATASSKTITASDNAAQDAPATSTQKESRMHPSMTTIPRLISVVEIIKREYLKTLDPTESEAGALFGLHQYNEIGELEQNIPDSTGDPERDRAQAVTLALQGKRYLRQHKVAFLKVTLCRKELPELAAKGATYQPPVLRRLSKTARARLKRRQKHEEQMNVT
ncbi:hypothetical protein B0H21DRAFT_753277 [Amylocystis lapponica]|nr:hypothetical protein B0H21DRAFT_753277 [Amylocystis lapponica]